MGRDKATLQLDGVTLTRRLADLIEPFVARVVLIGDSPAAADAAHIHRVVDKVPGEGPLAGMLAAHARAPDCAWLFVACDMPRVSAAAIGWLIAQRSAAHDAVIPMLDEDELQPLLAIYEPAGLRALQVSYDAGVRSPRKLAAHPRVATPTVPAELRDAWRNANTPEEWRAL